MTPKELLTLALESVSRRKNHLLPPLPPAATATTKVLARLRHVKPAAPAATDLSQRPATPTSTATDLGVAAGAMCVAGALHGLAGQPAPLVQFTAATAAVMLGAANEQSRASARSVFASLVAVAVYDKARDVARGIAERRAEAEREVAEQAPAEQALTKQTLAEQAAAVEESSRVRVPLSEATPVAATDGTRRAPQALTTPVVPLPALRPHAVEERKVRKRESAPEPPPESKSLRRWLTAIKRDVNALVLTPASTIARRGLLERMEASLRAAYDAGRSARLHEDREPLDAKVKLSATCALADSIERLSFDRPGQALQRRVDGRIVRAGGPATASASTARAGPPLEIRARVETRARVRELPHGRELPHARGDPPPRTADPAPRTPDVFDPDATCVTAVAPIDAA